MNDLLLEHFGVVDEQLGSLIHQILRDVDTGGLPAVATHKRKEVSTVTRAIVHLSVLAGVHVE